MSQDSWLQTRFGLGSLVDSWLETPLLGTASWGRSLGAAFVVAIGLTMVTGLGMGVVYSPSTAGAWASVYYLEYVLKSGWFLRSLHMVAAESTIVLGISSIFASVIEGRYRFRRDVAFWCQAALVATTFIFCVSGNPLRWDVRGYFGFIVETNIAGEAPVVGKWIRSLLLGGSTLNNYTLTRLFSLHTMLLPLAAAGLLWMWVRSSKRAAQQPEQPAQAYGQGQLLRDVIVSVVVVIAVSAGAYFLRAPLEAPADPLANYNARPEWYFVALYVLRNAVPASMQSLLALSVPPVVGLVLLLIPLLDRSQPSKFSKRIPGIVAITVPLLAGVVLTGIGLQHDRDDQELKASMVKSNRITTRALQLGKMVGIPPAGALEMLHRDPVLHGEELFKDNCASCHRLGELGPQPGQETAPNLNGWGSKEWVMNLLEDPDHPAYFGTSAFKGQMPSMTKAPKDPDAAKNFSPMSKADREEIANYLAAEATGTASEKHDPKGAKLIERRCTGCHLFKASTESDDSGTAPELEHWASPGWIRAQIANPGTVVTYRPHSMDKELKGHMPRYDKKLSEADIQLLTRFVHYRSRLKPAQALSTK
jgi:ubiquinol-cytochrome c reductase cytochrome b subunit